MKDHNNLDDLIIDDMDAKSKNNVKSFLSTVILIIIVLIIAIFSTKMLLKEPEKPVLDDQNYTQTANLGLQLETNGTAKDDINSTAISQDVQPAMPASTDANATSNDVNLTQTAINTKPVQPPKTTEQKLKKIASVNKEVNKSIVKPGKVSTAVKNETYFIQVGSFTSKPNETFLSVIKNSDYNYQIKTINNGKIKISKFLIGPFESRAKAENELAGIKNRINKSAFIVKQ
jgi:DedD protein